MRAGFTLGLNSRFYLAETIRRSTKSWSVEPTAPNEWLSTFFTNFCNQITCMKAERKQKKVSNKARCWLVGSENFKPEQNFASATVCVFLYSSDFLYGPQISNPLIYYISYLVLNQTKSPHQSSLMCATSFVWFMTISWKNWELLGKKSSWRNHEITWHQDLVFDLNLKNCYLKDSWIHSPFPPSFTTLYPFLSASTFWSR